VEGRSLQRIRPLASPPPATARESKGGSMSSLNLVPLKGIEESLRGSEGKHLHPGWIPVLEQVPLFQALSKRHLGRVARLAELKRFKSGAAVVRAGARGDAFYVMLDGSARVETPDGHTRDLHAGDYFGELALLDGAPRAATVSAIGSLATARIARTGFLKLLRDEPAIGVGLAHGLVSIVRDLQAQ
jgi:CRP/FNR family cyclic AMP-dependent transcriptional regulator